MGTKTSLSAGYIIQGMLESSPVAGMTSKIFGVVWDNATLPYVTHRICGFDQTPTKSGNFCDTVLAEVCCYAADLEGCTELAEAVREALDDREGEYEELEMRSCILINAEQFWEDDAYVMVLKFSIRI